jgi:hypothetical protein
LHTRAELAILGALGILGALVQPLKELVFCAIFEPPARLVACT